MSDIATLIVSIVVAIFGSSGFWSYLQSKKDKTQDILLKIDTMDKNIANLKGDTDAFHDKYAEDKAKDCRTRILRFADEIRAGTKHSKDMYENVLLDCDSYEDFCSQEKHKHFKNSIAGMSIKKIREHYQQDDFL
ncbi:MAG: hypothetical protein Q4D13_02800 [Erysipelotrichaceae bacterium]|nr:hypothetical protein [Erysipelotrichaceae bacterium]